MENMNPTTLIVALLIAAVATTIPTATAEDIQACQSYQGSNGSATLCATVKNVTIEECTYVYPIGGDTIGVGSEDCRLPGVLVTGSG
jgi:hypothetical protein